MSLKIASFITKLYNMVDEDSDNGISWNETGDSIIISDLKIFAEQTLFKVYKNPNYTSFARQLNLYGFNKLNRSYTRPTEKGKDDKDNEPKEFYNELFGRGKKDLQCKIKRKPRNQKYVANNASPSSRGKRRKSSDVDDYGYEEEGNYKEESMSVTGLNNLEETISSLVKRNQALTCIVSSLKLELNHYKDKCRILEGRASSTSYEPPPPQNIHPSSLPSLPINSSPINTATKYSYAQSYEPLFNSAPPIHLNKHRESRDYFPIASAGSSNPKDAGRSKERKSVDSEYISVLEVD